MAALFDWKPGYIDPAGKEFTRLPRPPLDARVTGITITGTGTVVVAGTTGDIFTYDAPSGKWQPLLDTGQLRREFKSGNEALVEAIPH